MDGVAATNHCHDKKVSYEAERFEWGVMSPKQNILTLLAERTKKRVAQ